MNETSRETDGEFSRVISALGATASGGASGADALTADDLHIMRMFGLSQAEYLAALQAEQKKGCN